MLAFLHSSFSLFVRVITFPLRKIYILLFSSSKNPSANPQGSILKRLFYDFVRPHWFLLLCAIGFMMLASVANSATAWLMKPIVDKIFIGKDLTTLYFVSAGFVVVSLCKALGYYGQEVLMSSIGLKAVQSMQRRFYAHVIKQDLIFFNKHKTGDLMMRFLGDINSIRLVAVNLIINVGRDITGILSAIAVMVSQSPFFSLILLLVVPSIVIPVSILSKRSRALMNATLQQSSGLGNRLEQSLNGIRVVKSYNMEQTELNHVDTTLAAMMKFGQRNARIGAMVIPILEIFGGISIAIVLLYGGYMVIQGSAESGSFFAFLTALLLGYQPAKNLAKFHVSLQITLAAGGRYYTVMDEQPTILDTKDAHMLSAPRVHLRFKNIDFSYVANAPLFRNFSLDVPPNTMVAFVGRSGSGKSTLMNMIPRFYDVQGGSITINDMDIRSLTLESLRGHMALVSQDIVLFDDTVLNNVLYSRPEASRDDVILSLQQAAAEEFILDLPQQYDSLIGPRGTLLSGGQRQRIAIARAILRDAPLLLLDEATSALDTESEKFIQRALTKLMKGRTSVVIAHRLSTVMHADIIYVLDKGRIVEQGTHDELLKNPDGAYKHLYDLQFSNEFNTTQ